MTLAVFMLWDGVRGAPHSDQETSSDPTTRRNFSRQVSK